MPPVAERSLDVRADFPILARRFGERKLVYLDSAATAQKPAVVIEAVADYLRNHNANVHRGVYALAREADAAYDGARVRVAAFTGAEVDTTIFTKNVTEAINLVAYSWGRANLRAGDAVLITQMEHHANIVPWQVLCRERQATLRYLEVDERGELSLQQLEDELARGDVRLVAFTHISNVLGTINPVQEMTARVRAAGAVSLIDGAQAVPHMPVDVPSTGADFYAWTPSINETAPAARTRAVISRTGLIVPSTFERCVNATRRTSPRASSASSCGSESSPRSSTSR